MLESRSGADLRSCTDKDFPHVSSNIMLKTRMFSEERVELGMMISVNGPQNGPNLEHPVLLISSMSKYCNSKKGPFATCTKITTHKNSTHQKSPVIR